jgi:beta-galactosidase
MQDRLDATKDLAPLGPWTTTGVAGLFRQADRMFSSQQARFLVTETNAQSIGGPDSNFPPYPGQLAQSAFALISRGAAMIEYWHWHTLPYGFETYWAGVLPHSLEPGRVYRELADLGASLGRIGKALDGYEPDADVAILWSNPSRFALQFSPPFRKEGAPDAQSYERVIDAFHRGVIEAGRQARILHADQARATGAAALAERFPVLVAAGLYITADADLALLREYAEHGGHLVLGPRTGYADEEARARIEVAPARLGDAAGVTYEEFSNLEGSVPVTSDFATAAGTAELWIDGLIVDGAEVLARYEHPRFGDFPAVTTTAFGTGRISVLGAVPSPRLAADFIGWATPAAAASGLAGAASLPVTVSSGVVADGRRAWFVFNWSWTTQEITLSLPVTDLVTGARLDAGTTLTLDDWSTRAFIAR